MELGWAGQGTDWCGVARRHGNYPDLDHDQTSPYRIDFHSCAVNKSEWIRQQPERTSLRFVSSRLRFTDVGVRNLKCSVITRTYFLPRRIASRRG